MSIANIQLTTLSQRLAERELEITFSEKALEHISDAGFDPVYGARPLKRAIQQLVENPLAEKMLAGDFSAGQTIKVDVKQEQLSFS